MDGSVANLVDPDEVKPYQIHVSSAFPSPSRTTVTNPDPQVSSKYLDLTQKKLELTRLPHEVFARPADDPFVPPHTEVETLIDFW